MYCVYSERVPPTGTAGESLEGEQGLNRAHMKCIRIKIVIYSVGSSAVLKLS